MDVRPEKKVVEELGMKKGVVINQPVSELIAGLGHMDEIVIADAELPIPPGVRRIDLALTKGIPSFQDTLSVVLSEMCVERAVVAHEMADISPAVYELVVQSLARIEVAQLSYVDFKERTKVARAVIRTGEFTPYANIILISGVWGFG